MKEILDKLINNGYEAYIVGGYVRDYLLSLESNDIDICTNATIDEIINIFGDIGTYNKEYFSYHIKDNKYTYTITSYRKELEYYKNKPIKLEYTNSFDEDLKRRDFTINSIAMDLYGNIIDKLNGVDDIHNKIVKVIGNTYDRFNEDKTRIIRAIRFYVTLDFELDNQIKDFIEDYGYMLNDIPREYIKKELDKIFSNKNYIKFFELIDKYNLKKYLNIDYNIIERGLDRIGVWALLDTTLPLSNKEKKECKDIKNKKLFGGKNE